MKGPMDHTAPPPAGDTDRSDAAGVTRILSRRDFLVRSAGALAAVSFGPAACTRMGTGPDSPDGPPVDVIVVGAGLAGLVAAYELVRAGYDVVVLEAREEAGGRARTLRTPFDDGLIAEAGPARIPPSHDRTLGYVEHFEIETAVFYPQERDYLIVPSEGSGLPPYRESPEVFLTERYGGRDTWLKVPGGTDLLPAAFADALGARIRYGAPVTRIEQGASSVVASFGAGSTVGQLEASRLICTVPLPVVDRIVFDPALSGGKVAAWNALSYQDVTRVYVQYGSRIWEDDDLNGWGRTAVEELWQPAWDRSGPRGILMSYMFGSRAREVAAMDPDTIVPRFVERFDGFFPGSAQVAETGTYLAWADEPWIGGAFASSSPSFATTPSLASREGRIHFAGEHASGDRGWMQGALESGLRAAAEIDPSVTGERA